MTGEPIKRGSVFEHLSSGLKVGTACINEASGMLSDAGLPLATSYLNLVIHNGRDRTQETAGLRRAFERGGWNA